MCLLSHSMHARTWPHPGLPQCRVQRKVAVMLAPPASKGVIQRAALGGIALHSQRMYRRCAGDSLSGSVSAHASKCIKQACHARA